MFTWMMDHGVAGWMLALLGWSCIFALVVFIIWINKNIPKRPLY